MLPKCSFLFNSQNSRGEPSHASHCMNPGMYTLHCTWEKHVLRKCTLKMKSSTSTHVEFNLPGMDGVTDWMIPPIGSETSIQYKKNTRQQWHL